MDPATLATSVLAILTPYLTKLGESFAEDTGKKLWDVIRARFKDKPTADGAARKLASNANDPHNLTSFTSQLKNALEQHPDFAQEIEELVGQGHTAGNRFENISVGGNIGGSIVTGNGNVIDNTKFIQQSSLIQNKKANKQRKLSKAKVNRRTRPAKEHKKVGKPRKSKNTR